MRILSLSLKNAIIIGIKVQSEGQMEVYFKKVEREFTPAPHVQSMLACCIGVYLVNDSLNSHPKRQVSENLNNAALIGKWGIL